MALNHFGVLDLSNVTDFLISQLQVYWEGNPLWESLRTVSPFHFQITGDMPLELREATDGCQLSIYLFHVEPDKYQRNAAVTGPTSLYGAKRVPTIPFQPLSLDLYYLVTAYSKGINKYQEEQRAMSIVLRFFHENPILRGNVFLPGDLVPVHQELCVTMESEAQDTLSRLWQSMTAPFRMGVVYKVSVVFLTPPDEEKALAKEPAIVDVTAHPAQLPLSSDGEIAGTVRIVNYLSSVDPTPGQPRAVVRYRESPAAPAPGDLPVEGSGLAPPGRFYLQGKGLNTEKTSEVYLILPDGSEREVTGWTVGEPAPATPGDPPRLQTDSQMVLHLPPAVSATPDDSHAPFPGVYQIMVGSGPAGGAASFRSNAVVLSVAPWVKVVDSPVLSPNGDGTYTLPGRGFLPGKTELLLGALPLLPTAAAAPAKGEFAVTDSETILFMAPDAAPKGLLPVLVRVNHVQCAPACWIRL